MNKKKRITMFVCLFTCVGAAGDGDISLLLSSPSVESLKLFSNWKDTDVSMIA